MLVGMRFLMLNWRDPETPTAGGAERVSFEYLSALARRGHEVYWFANYFAGAEREKELGGIHLRRGGGRGTSIIAAWRWYRSQPPFDLVIDQHHGIPWLAPWWCGTRCVAYIHEVLGPIWGAFFPWPISLLGCWQERLTQRLYRNVPFWVGSRSTQQALHARGIRSVTVIPYGIQPISLPALDQKPLRPPLKLIVVSRFSPNKRIDHAVRLLKLLTDRRIAAHLTIVGGGMEETRLRRLVRDLGLERHVEFPGMLPEPEKNRRLQESHFLVHTSLREGWGLNVIEASALGTPAIVYPVAGLVDSTVHGETGWVVPDETPQALANTLEATLKDTNAYEQIRTRAWQRAKGFHWDRVLPQACEWLENQARKTPPGRSRP